MYVFRGAQIPGRDMFVFRVDTGAEPWTCSGRQGHRGPVGGVYFAPDVEIQILQVDSVTTSDEHNTVRVFVANGCQGKEIYPSQI